MSKKPMGLFALVLAALLVFGCLSGCKNEKDVYGAASDFIKVNHPETPNKNIFSDDDYTGSDITSTEKTSSSNSSGDVTSDGAKTDSSDSSGNSDNSGSGDSTSSETVSSSNSSTGTTYSPVEGDHGPVMIF